MAVRKETGKLIIFLAVLVFVFLISLFTGRYPHPGLVNPLEVFKDTVGKSLILNLRLPRSLTALFLGMVLSSAGTVFQMIFSNPLVEPGFLGVSQGAAFGAAGAIVFISTSAIVIQLSAALFALGGLAFSYIVARKIRFGGWVLRLILAGIAVSAFFNAGIGIIKYTADPVKDLPEITFWMLGGLWGTTWNSFLTILPVVSITLLVLFLIRWRINVLSLSDEASFSLGAAPERERILFLVLATAGTAAVVSVSGIVSWVGLIIPHISRRVFRTDTRYSLPGSMLLGGIFTIFCDTAARTILPGEIPLGILTSLIGAVVFIALLMSRTVKVEK